MSSRPRNPRYWPRMKVRGARRRQLDHGQIMAGMFDRLYEPRSAEALGEMAAAFAEFGQRVIVTPETLSLLGKSIMEVDIAGDS